MKNRPLVSVVMPSFNASAFIGSSINSVLCQSFCDFELLVIDDCSTDDTIDVVRSFEVQDKRIRLIKNPNRLGPSASRNRGIEESVGHFIAFIDSDDLMSTRAIEMRVTMFESSSQAIGSYCPTIYIDQRNRYLGFTTRGPEIVRFTDLAENLFSTSMVMVQKPANNKKIYFDPQFSFGEDWDLWLRLTRSGCHFIKARNCFVCRRILPDSWSHSNCTEDILQRIQVMEIAWKEDKRVPDAIEAYRGGLMMAKKNDSMSIRCWATGMSLIARNEIKAALRVLTLVDSELIRFIPKETLFYALETWLILENGTTRNNLPKIFEQLLTNLKQLSSCIVGLDPEIITHCKTVVEETKHMRRTGKIRNTIAAYFAKYIERINFSREFSKMLSTSKKSYGNNWFQSDSAG